VAALLVVAELVAAEHVIARVADALLRPSFA
jgi:hypothetical protein